MKKFLLAVFSFFLIRQKMECVEVRFVIYDCAFNSKRKLRNLINWALVMKRNLAKRLISLVRNKARITFVLKKFLLVIDFPLVSKSYFNYYIIDRLKKKHTGQSNQEWTKLNLWNWILFQVILAYFFQPQM